MTDCGSKNLSSRPENKADKLLYGIICKTWDAKNFAFFNVLTAQRPITECHSDFPFTVSVPTVLCLPFRPQGREDSLMSHPGWRVIGYP